MADGSLTGHEDNLEHSAVALYEELAWTHDGWERPMPASTASSWWHTVNRYASGEGGAGEEREKEYRWAIC